MTGFHRAAAGRSTCHRQPTRRKVDGHASVNRLTFVAAIDTARSVRKQPAADNLKSLAMVFAAIESAKTPAARPHPIVSQDHRTVTNPSKAVRHRHDAQCHRRRRPPSGSSRVAGPRLRELRAVLLADPPMGRISPNSASARSMPRSAIAISPFRPSACSVTRSRIRNMDRETLQGWKDCIDNAHHFGATCVAGFTGRIRGNRPLTDSLPRYKAGLVRTGQTRCRQGCQDRLRELRHGRQLGRPATGTSPTIPTPGS